jgi:hypothetical protein
MRYRSLQLGLTALAFAALAPASQAFLIDPTGGSTIWQGGGGTSFDDVGVSRSLGGTFFGGITSLTVATNGHLNNYGSTAFSNLAMPFSAGGLMIAPNWDDFIVRGGSTGATTRVSDRSGTGWYAATFENIEHFATTGVDYNSFQVAMFNANTTIGGFNFLEHDIAFSYLRIDSIVANRNATIGINMGDGSTAYVLPGTSNGVVTSANANLVPIFSTTNQFVLFRWNGQSYDGSIQTVPEPATMAALGLGALALIRRRRSAK